MRSCSLHRCRSCRLCSQRRSQTGKRMAFNTNRSSSAQHWQDTASTHAWTSDQDTRAVVGKPLQPCCLRHNLPVWNGRLLRSRTGPRGCRRPQVCQLQCAGLRFVLASESTSAQCSDCLVPRSTVCLTISVHCSAVAVHEAVHDVHAGCRRPLPSSRMS